MDACELGIAELYKGEYEKLTGATKDLLRENLIKLRDEQYKAEKVGNTIYWGEGGTSNRGGNTVVEKNDEDFRKQSQAFHGGARIERESGGEGADAQEVTRYSISAPSYTDRMVDISDVMTVAEHKAAMLENAKRMASEGVDAQKIGRKVVRIYIQGRS